ncbi:hypothetical protein [Nocardia sp. NPDC058705]|uniref:hypothetical protein n=1 Tax=Nocardia TaxID=1817 RepID=UPI0036855B24
MDAIYRQYAQEMHAEFGYLACWAPSVPLALGDVGVVTKGRFDGSTTLAALGISFKGKTQKKKFDFEYSSARSVEIRANGELGVNDNLRSSASIQFDRGGATFFQATDSTIEQIVNLVALEADLRRCLRDGLWRREYVVITSLVHTGPTVIFVSNGPGGRVDFSVRGDGLGTPLPIARAAADLAITSKTELAATVIAPEGATPLFRAGQLRRRLIGGERLRIRGPEDSDEWQFTPLGWAEMADPSEVSNDPRE